MAHVPQKDLESKFGRISTLILLGSFPLSTLRVVRVSTNFAKILSSQTKIFPEHVWFASVYIPNRCASRPWDPRSRHEHWKKKAKERRCHLVTATWLESRLMVRGNRQISKSFHSKRIIACLWGLRGIIHRNSFREGRAFQATFVWMCIFFLASVSYFE